MNGERSGPVMAVLLMAMLACPCPISALDSVGELATPWQDPLKTTPPALTSGVVLPGDGAAASCPATKDFATPLALTEAVDLALCNNARIKAAWADIKVRAAAAGVARAAYLPTLSGTASYREEKTSYPDSGIKSKKNDSYPLNGTANWRIFDFGGREANLEAALQGLAAALATHDAVLQKTLGGVIQAYFDAQVTQAAWQAKAHNEEIARSTLAAAKRREAKGAGAAGDTLQAATALARASLDKNRAQGANRKALSVLLYSIVVPAQTTVILAEDLDPPRQAAEDLDTWLQEAGKRHPAIVAARAQLEAARYTVTATRSEGLPTLNFSTSYYENGRLEQSPSATRTQELALVATVSVPIFDGFSHTYKVRGAEAQVEQKDAELRDTEHQSLMEVVKAHADAGAALQNLEASARLLATALEALEVSTRKYAKGAADILEILNAQTALAEARQERIRSLAEWRSARLRLLAGVGLLGRTAITP